MSNTVKLIKSCGSVVYSSPVRGKFLVARSNFYWSVSNAIGKVASSKRCPKRVGNWLHGTPWVWFNAASYFNTSLVSAVRRYS